ncbi:uncharacterized protein PODANS_7_3890 [Podospora anserina S mat+]|uniref:Podospora anserina S mat+ genomic DNA chromosome 7, supercontig 1 n=1 Tax=Podospora anserina (strain S / ATCC MYA-4624 / DSM 980 / FGSC 10383) TaxID=515849 RepID=B2AV74_PODAN|nr:uncharacterized protein PODANS_7_3890 [Podospora anserina S mat+]CAP68297.1 unnamed protein product [Podospora anserina S mat+]CDP31768.1 Putative protein of unknown function [Podospora anserina S mat+]
MFGPILRISEEALVRLTYNMAIRHAPVLKTLDGRVVRKLSGGFNFIFIIAYGDFKLVVRVPAFWGKRWTEEAALSMRSEVATLKIIRERTTVPVPEVYRFDLTFGNDNRQPYICTSFLIGTPVSHAWYDKEGAQGYVRILPAQGPFQHGQNYGSTRHLAFL